MEENLKENTKEKNSTLVIASSIILAGAIIALAVIFANKQAPVADKQVATQNSPSDRQQTAPGNADLLKGAHVLGNPNAKVIVVEFGDFQCPFCERFFQSTEQDFINKYVKSGQVLFAFHNFAFLGQESVWAAEASECANAQDKFWEYHNYLYSHQGGENSGAFSKANLEKFAVQVGLDQQKFNSCLESDTYLSLVQQETSDGQKFGVTGTPTTFINGNPVVGAVPTNQFESEIDQALKSAK